KPIVTTTACLWLVQSGQLTLDAPIAQWLPRWRGSDREHVTVEDLLSHSAGLTAHLPLYRDCTGRAEFESTICTLPLEYAPRTQSVYSDLGFMLLAFVVETVSAHTLDSLFEHMCARGASRLHFRPRIGERTLVAPTGFDRWRGRVLQGEVHDRNAWALGGVAGHAGLFGTAEGVGRFARMVLNALAGADPGVDPALVRRFSQRSRVAGSSRALGWDTMLPTSSCGTRMSPSALGHTGYTGTSLWLDPARQAYFVLLTNRVHPDDRNEEILTIRPRFHDSAGAALNHVRGRQADL
ncbi:MAG: serine hydrolase domain-containing protein, partial [Vicinamibacterales bacterium]